MSQIYEFIPETSLGIVTRPVLARVLDTLVDVHAVLPVRSQPVARVAHTSEGPLHVHTLTMVTHSGIGALVQVAAESPVT